jgi:hypothetical protein
LSYGAAYGNRLQVFMLSQPTRTATLFLIAMTTVSRQSVFSSDVRDHCSRYSYSLTIATPVEKSAESLIICYTNFRTIKPPLLFPVFLFSSTSYRMMRRDRRLVPSSIENRKSSPLWSILHFTCHIKLSYECSQNKHGRLIQKSVLSFATYCIIYVQKFLALITWWQW